MINQILLEIEQWLKWTWYSVYWDIKMEIKTWDAFEHSIIDITVTK